MNRNTYVHINSEIDRTPNDLTTSWTTFLADPILVSSNSEIRVSVEACEIPNLLYQFPNESSVFWWIFDPAGANTLKSFQIDTNRNFTDGNVLAAYLNTNLQVAEGLQFTFNSNTSKITITNLNVQPIKIIQSYKYAIFPNVYNQVIDKLGFTQAISTNLIQNATLTGASPLRLLRTNCYYLCLDNIQSSYKEAITPNPYRTAKIIARLTAGNFGSLSQLQYPPASYLRLANNQNITFFKFSILDDNLYPIEDLYAPITFTLKITQQ